MLEQYYKTKEQLFEIALKYLKEVCKFTDSYVSIVDITKSHKDYETKIIYRNYFYDNNIELVSTRDFEDFIKKNWTR